MQNNIKYINLSWAVVGICQSSHKPLSFHIPDIDKDEAAAVEHYVIGYLAFWHIAFVDESRLVPCHDEALREAARQKIARYIANHQPIETLPRFCIVLLRQSIAPMETDGMSRVYQVYYHNYSKMKTLIMDRHSKFGLKTMCLWILFLTVLYGSYAVVTNSPLSGLLDKETGGFISLVFFMAWALVWFAIGRHFSRDYAMKKTVWKRAYPDINEAEIDKIFRGYYFSRMTKMLSIVFFFAVPAYLAANVRGIVTLRNGIYIGTLMVVSIICGLYYKKHRTDCQFSAK